MPSILAPFRGAIARRSFSVACCVVAAGMTWSAFSGNAAAPAPAKFSAEEATIASIQQAILARELTSTELVKIYLERIKAYNGASVEQPQGILGAMKAIPHA